MKLLFTLILLCAGLFANTLQEIRNSGVIRVGVRDGRPPFSEISGGKFEALRSSLPMRSQKRFSVPNKAKCSLSL